MRTATAALLSLSLAFAGPAAAQTLTVGGAGADHSRIQAAVDAAPEGATIVIRAGRYTETVEIGKPLKLTAEGDVVVDANKRGSAIHVSGNGVTLEGIEVTNASSKDLQAGLLISGDDNTVIGVRATGNNFGIVVRLGTGNTIRDSDASGNAHDGIVLAGAKDTLVEANTLGSNGRAGIWLEGEHEAKTTYEATGNRVLSNTATGNASFGIALNSGANDNEISGNTVGDNGEKPEGAGILLNCGPMRNLVAGNGVAGNVPHGILLQSAAALNRIYANKVAGSATGIGVFDSTANQFVDNIVSGSSSYGVWLDDMSPLMGEGPGAMYPVSTMNVLHHNDLVGNRVNAFDRSGLAWAPPGMSREQLQMMQAAMAPNQWDDGAAGNHFDDFDEGPEGFVDNNDDGIGDVAHAIPGGVAADQFPLAEWRPSGIVPEASEAAFALPAAFAQLPAPACRACAPDAVAC